jgi:hypothetical protein
VWVYIQDWQVVIKLTTDDGESTSSGRAQDKSTSDHNIVNSYQILYLKRSIEKIKEQGAAATKQSPYPQLQSWYDSLET